MLTLLIAKFVMAGVLVVVFAVISEVVRPRTLAGIFAAAPSIALGSLAIVYAFDGPTAGYSEALGMMAGAAAMVVYIIMSVPVVRSIGSLGGSTLPLLAWLAVAVALYIAMQPLVG